MLDLIAGYPSPAHLASLGERQLANRLTELAPRLGKRWAADIVRALCEQSVVVTGTHAVTIVLPRLAQQLATLRQQREEIASEVERRVLWRRSLLRRSQRRRITWDRMRRLADRWLPAVRIVHPWPENRFDVRHPR